MFRSGQLVDKMVAQAALSDGLLGERRASMLVLATILEASSATARTGHAPPQASVLMMTPELADLRWESIADVLHRGSQLDQLAAMLLTSSLLQMPPQNGQSLIRCNCFTRWAL